MELTHENGWREWEICPPAISTCPVQIMREEWDHPQTVLPNEIPAAMNARSLFWKITGIYTEAESSMSWPVLQQANAMVNPLLACLGILGGKDAAIYEKCKARNKTLKYGGLPCVKDEGHEGYHEDCTGCWWR